MECLSPLEKKGCVSLDKFAATCAMDAIACLWSADGVHWHVHVHISFSVVVIQDQWPAFFILLMMRLNAFECFCDGINMWFDLVCTVLIRISPASRHCDVATQLIHHATKKVECSKSKKCSRTKRKAESCKKLLKQHQLLAHWQDVKLQELMQP